MGIELNCLYPQRDKRKDSNPPSVWFSSRHETHRLRRNWKSTFVIFLLAPICGAFENIMTQEVGSSYQDKGYTKKLLFEIL